MNRLTLTAGLLRSRRRWIVLIVVFPLLLSACGTLWNRANAGALQDDLVSLFSQHDIEIPLEDCDMIGTTRSGYCRFQDTQGKAEALVTSFNLAPVVLEYATVPFIDAELEAGCGAFSWILEGSQGRMYMISGRPDRLRLSSGTAFEYLLVIHDPSSGEACVQVSYSYG